MARGEVNNTAFREALRHLNRDISRLPPSRGNQHIFKLKELKEVYNKYNSRCVYCGIALETTGRYEGSVWFKFYTPIKYGGRLQPENLVPCCRTHYIQYKVTRGIREEIPDLNTFADTTEQLIRAVFSVELARREHSSDLALYEEKVVRIKRLLNIRLEDIAQNMRYIAFKDWKPENFEIVQEDENTLPDLVEKLAGNIAGEEGRDVLDSNKESITDSVRQIVTTKQYHIVK